MSIRYIEEPKLIFGDSKSESDICYGLTKHGPYGVKVFKTINAGIIGDATSNKNFKQFLEKIKSRIDNKDPKYWPFPGLYPNNNLKFSIDIIYEETITTSEMNYFKQDLDCLNPRLERIRYAIELYDHYVKKIHDYDPNPDVIILPIPNEILIKCRAKTSHHTERILTASLQKKISRETAKIGHNFHHMLKIVGQKYGIPTQLIFPNSLHQNPSHFGKQDLWDIAWNFSVASLYKANELPWKYFDFPPDTCFIDISFHRDISFDEKVNMHASIAQIFLSDANNIILRGESFPWYEERIRNPHMPKTYAEDLFKSIIAKYREHYVTLIGVYIEVS